METAGFDPAYLERWREFIPPEQLGQLARDFLAKLEAEVAELGTDLTAADMPLLARQAHALVGSAANFGAVRIAELARALERAAAEGGAAPLASLHAALAAEVPRIEAALNAWLAAPETALAG
jgi:HPt (histidine-containing phosphotransfer) domain-containing protein